MLRKFFLGILVFLMIVSVSAKSPHQFGIPATAVEVAPNVYYLGHAFKDGQKVDGIMFVDKKADARAGGGVKTGASSCFSVFAKGARWKSTEQYVLDTANNDGLNESFVASRISQSMNAWDSQISYSLFGPRDISSIVDGIDASAPDGKNEILFGTASDPNTIAVTTAWGIFGGPIGGRQLIEFDLAFNDAFQFGDAGPTSETTNANVNFMDLQAITTHELGHAAGLGHPGSSCTQETMYAYAQAGETKKRTLNSGDKKGLHSLYG